ncbi:MAG: hypothetical protein SOV91_04785 [Eubacteriales bacterium]|nr:hypothetical protein [Eubacteriales bacterium]
MKRKVWYLGLFFLITCSLLLVSVGCGFSQDFSQTPAYSALFSDQDSDTQKTLKNLVIKQIEAYNAQDPEAYASAMDWDEQDRTSFCEQFWQTAKNVRTELSLGALSAVVLDSNTSLAQVGALVQTRLIRVADGAVIDEHYNQVTYTMTSRDGTWYITTIENGADQYYD